MFVEGNAELTPARLAGQFDPSRVLTDGYVPDVFVDGPLAQAAREGSLLYIEELNRVPEETLNLLITAMSERELHIPRLGHIAVDDGFRLVAAMNPFDAVGTARISAAVYDRMCRIAMGYQDADEEVTIAAREAAVPARRAHGQRCRSCASDSQPQRCAGRLLGARRDRHAVAGPRAQLAPQRRRQPDAVGRIAGCSVWAGSGCMRARVGRPKRSWLRYSCKCSARPTSDPSQTMPGLVMAWEKRRPRLGSERARGGLGGRRRAGRARPTET